MKLGFRIAGVIALAGMSTTASAQGWIAGMAFGEAAQQDFDIAGGITTRDDTDDSMRIFGGYMLSPMQGVIVSWIDIGTAFYSGPALGGFANHSDAEGYDISYVVGWAPGSQTRFSLFGTLGVFAWDQDVIHIDSTGAYPFQDEGTSFSAGVGTEITLVDNFSVHIEYQLFKDVGEDAPGSSRLQYDREVVSVGVAVRFGRPRE